CWYLLPSSPYLIVLFPRSGAPARPIPILKPSKEMQKAHVSKEQSMIKLGLIGYGYWGPRIARNFQSAPGCKLSMIADRRPDALPRAQQDHPYVQMTSDPCEVITSPEIDAVAIVTPVWTHFELAKAALQNGKHVFVEKPFTSTTAQA